ncbi:MAG: NAD-dependent epimerase/dehydratase family protein [Alphaproteobacteria bacterium]|nr:NAD-dependent epimerase/dehydratase family protein [Alphaproteobacteria bacterium]
MKLILFGATGMIGEGALIECLDHPDVESVLAVVRKPTGRQHDKLTELVHDDFLDYSAVEHRFAGFDACLYCLGISAQGMSEADYRRITFDFTVAAADAMLRQSPGLRMCFISGAGTNPASRQMWARVKGEAEQALLAMPFSSAHMFRPAGILPEKGVQARIPSYAFAYRWFSWAFRLLRAVAPGMVTTTDELGRALIRVARDGHTLDILEGRDIHEIGR